MNLYLGIDGGGTKTAAVIVNETGQELGRGVGGPCNLAVLADEILRRSIRDAIRSATLAADLEPSSIRFVSVCAGAAGASVEARRLRFEEILRAEITADRYRVEPDYLTAWWGATHGEPGVIVIAGTGAAAYGRSIAGAACLVDGLGFLLGDRGGGFWIGLAALRCTLDHVQRRTVDPLVKAVLSHTGAQNRDQIVQWLYTDFQPARVAALAPLVGQLADAENQEARRLISEAARELRTSVFTVFQTLGIPEESMVYPLGGAWNLCDFFRSEFAAPQPQPSIHSRLVADPFSYAPLRTASPRSDAAVGAALLARNSTEASERQ